MKPTKTRRPEPPARRRSKGLLLAVLLVVAALGAFGFQYWRNAAKAGAVRSDLLSRIEAATAKVPVDGSELSQLVAQLNKLPDHESARDLLAAQARIELARDRPERALAGFGNLASQPEATPAEQGLGARILLRVHEAGGGDVAAATGVLKQALTFAENAYEASGDVDDLLRAWQAATRLGDQAAAARLAARVREHADSPAARLVTIADEFDPAKDGVRLAEARAAFARPPIELDAMQLLVVLQGGAIEDAAASADALLARAAGVSAARWAATLVFHACALSHAAATPARTAWLDRRDVQLDWLLARSPGDDPRRDRWNALRNQR